MKPQVIVRYFFPGTPNLRYTRSPANPPRARVKIFIRPNVAASCKEKVSTGIIVRVLRGTYISSSCLAKVLILE
jgi:hypothetical protein